MANIEKKIIVSAEYENYRIDRFLVKKFSLPQSLIHKDLRKNRIKVNRKKIKYDHRLVIGDEVNLYKNYDIKKNQSKKDICKELILKFRKSILFRSNDYLIINKWNGIASQGGSKIGISIDDIIKEFNKKDSKLRLVHRLDKETSGIMVLSSNIKSSRYFHQIFSSRKIKKIYYAIVENKPPKRLGYFKDPIIEKGESLDAETKYEVKRSLKNNLYLLKLYPKTGRKHQIRIHCSINGCPILADSKYNNSSVYKNESNNLFLHAGEIEFIDQSGKKINIKADLPIHFRNYIKIDN
tara:strand:- start:1194 stop:2078 length:885 start_codon:yes stop_codon:yes gene_type:complete